MLGPKDIPIRVVQAVFVLIALVVGGASRSFPAQAGQDKGPGGRDEGGVLLRAVGFALTGRDDATVQPIDRKNCVFQIDREIFHLNNVHRDRIFLKGEPNPFGAGLHHLTVTIHGDKPVYEKRRDGLQEKDLGPEVVREWKKLDPAAFQRSTMVLNEATLSLVSEEEDRIFRAWQYI